MAHDSNRSGLVRLERGALSTLAPSTTGWKTIASASDEGKPVSRTVRVAVSRQGSESEQLSNIRLPCGVWWKLGSSVPWVGEGNAQCNGALRFRFGSGAASRTLVCDLASGEYVVPSCEHLYVDAVRYTPGSDAAAIAALGLDKPTEVQAEVSDGAASDFTPMICTARSTWGVGGADASAVVAVPQGAYAFDLYSDSPIGDANAFEVSPPGALRNFVTQVCQPYGPLPVVSNTITVQARGAAPSAARLVFFVR